MTTQPLPDRIRRALAKATPGPWHADEGFGGVWVVTGGPTDFAVHPSVKDGMPGVVLGAGNYGNSYLDADLIVLLRNNIEALLADNDRLRAVAEAAQAFMAARDEWADHYSPGEHEFKDALAALDAAEEAG